MVAPSLNLLVGTHFDLGHWTLLAVVGAGVQLAVGSAGTSFRTVAVPAFEVAAAFGRRLGPGAVELEVSFLYSRINIPLVNLQASGLFIGVGYRFDLSGGK